MSETAVEAKPRRTRGTAYTASEIERGLIELVACNGNARQAAANLDQDPSIRSIPYQTLTGWKSSVHANRYREIRAELLPQIREHAADEHMALVSASMAVETEFLEALKGKAADIPARDLPGAVRNLATGAAIHTEKAQLLNDQPTERRSIDLAGTLQELKAMGADPKVVLNLTPSSEETIKEDDDKGPALREPPSSPPSDDQSSTA